MYAMMKAMARKYDRRYDILKKECEAKGAAPRKIGFGN